MNLCLSCSVQWPRTKSRIGRFPKNYEKLKKMKRVGRPSKKVRPSTSPNEIPVQGLSELTDSPLPSNQWVMQNHEPDDVVICRLSNQWQLFIYQKRIIRYTVKRACALIRIFIAILTRGRSRSLIKYAHAAANL